jgi:hypothetical protein
MSTYGAGGGARAATAATLRNIAAQFPDMARAAQRGDPAALQDIQRILASGNATPRNLNSRVGVPVGGVADRKLTVPPRAMPESEMIPAPPQPRTGGMSDLEGAPVRAPDGPRANDADELFTDGPPPKRPGYGKAVAGAAAAGAGGAYIANQMRDDGATTADLKAETKPPPSVTTAEETPAKTSPREQAYAMMADLNARRRAAGGEVPDARKTQAEIDRLLMVASQGDNAQVRSNSVPKPSGPTDYRTMAQQKLAELNAWQARHGSGHPRSMQLKAEMQQLYSLADKQANARTTAFPRRG